MHEVELVRRVWNRLQEGYDYDTGAPNRWALSQGMTERVVQTTLRILGIPIRPDGSVVIDAAPIVEAYPPLSLPRQSTDLRVVEILPWSDGLIWETVGIFGGESAEERAIACTQQIPDDRAQAIRIATRSLNPAEPLPAAPTLGDLYGASKPEGR